MVTITNRRSRRLLAEGRTNGMGFAFLRPLVGKNRFITVMPCSPCKDYLAEVIITEQTGIATRAHGFTYPKKLNIFSNVAHLGISIVKQHYGNYYNYSKSFEEDVKKLKENYKNLQKLINNLETTLELSSLTKIEEANNDMFLVTFPSEWVKSTHSISLYTLLLRVGMFVDNPDVDIVSYMSNFKYNLGDGGTCKGLINKMKSIIKEKTLPPNTIPYNVESLKNKSSTPHNNGIMSWNGKFEEVVIK